LRPDLWLKNPEATRYYFPVPKKVMKDSEDIQRLIRLKRYESPGDAYFETFLEEFKDRQRSELLHRSARGLLVERISMWFDEMNGTKWLLPLGATAAAAITLGVYLNRSEVAENVRPGSSLTTSTVKSERTDHLTAPASVESGVISLQLPPRDNRVPGLGTNVLSGVHGLLPAGSQGSFREL